MSRAAPLALTLALVACITWFATPAAANEPSDVVITTEGGERFHLTLNGVRHTETPTASIKVEGLVGASMKLQLVFEDSALGHMSKNLYLSPGKEVTYVVKRNRKGEWKLSYVSEAPRGQGGPAPSVVAETRATVDAGIGVEMGVEMGVEPGLTTPEPPEPAASSAPRTRACTPTSADAHGQLKKAVAEKSFSDSKMTVAKQSIKGACPTAAQVAEVAALFDFESDRIEISKFAYDYCHDPANFYKVNDSFEFESSIEELEAYIQNRP